ncbi:MAG: hypothetical protein K0S47_2821 [Herbinix sp.]|jgi:predicted GNAT family acetyltransferase|nr:hypothetical protein [Herbinix sp.]
MVVKEYENAEAFLHDYEETMLEREAVSQLILYNAYKNRNTKACESCMFGAILDEEKPILLFCNVAPHNLVAYITDVKFDKDKINGAASLLAEYIHDQKYYIRGINARNDVCHSFIERYKTSVKCTFQENLAMDIMEIRSINDIKPIEGKQRLATMDEAKLLTEWMIEFKIEALASELDYEAALQKTKRYIEEEKVYIYQNTEQQIVTMAMVTRQLVHGCAISYVFTPEEFRGKGYAAANIFYLSKLLLEAGNHFCTLFVDKKNPISNRAYEKVGYHILEDNYEYRVIPVEV